MKTLRKILFYPTLCFMFLHLNSCKKDEAPTPPEPSVDNTIVKDIDGNSYPIIQIGTQKWMGKNLQTTKLKDGTAISNLTTTTQWVSTTSAAMCWYNNDYETYGKVYGALYNLVAVKTEKLCPEGWRVSSDDDWKTLEIFLGMPSSDLDYSYPRGSNEGGKLKEEGQTHWDWPNAGAVNSHQFTALAGGVRSGRYGSFDEIRKGGYFWTSTISPPTS